MSVALGTMRARDATVQLTFPSILFDPQNEVLACVRRRHAEAKQVMKECAASLDNHACDVKHQHHLRCCSLLVADG